MHYPTITVDPADPVTSYVRTLLQERHRAGATWETLGAELGVSSSTCALVHLGHVPAGRKLKPAVAALYFGGDLAALEADALEWARTASEPSTSA